jgi:hypothetical protein
MPVETLLWERAILTLTSSFSYDVNQETSDHGTNWFVIRDGMTDAEVMTRKVASPFNRGKLSSW